MPITLKGYEAREFGVLMSQAYLDSAIDRDEPIMWLSLYDYPDDLEIDTFRGFYRDDDSVQNTIPRINLDARGVSNREWYLDNISFLSQNENEFLDFFSSLVKRYPITKDNITIENDDGVVVLIISVTAELDEDISFRYLTVIGDTEDAYGKYEMQGLPHVTPLENGDRVDRTTFSYYLDFKGNFYQADYQAMGEAALVDFWSPRQLVSNPNNPYGVSPGAFETKTSGHFNYEAQTEIMAYMDETAPITTASQSRPIITTTQHSNLKPFYIPIIYFLTSGGSAGEPRLLRRYSGNSSDYDVHYELESSLGNPYYAFSEMYFSTTYPAVSQLTNETINYSNLDGLYSIGTTFNTSYRIDNIYPSTLYPGGVALPAATIYPLTGMTYYLEQLEQDTALVAGDSFSAIIRIELTSL